MKRLPAPENAAMATLGMTGSLEGADDPPAGIFRKKGNVVGQIVAILSVLSLQVQGCQSKDNDSLGELTPSLVIFTMVLGLAVLLFCRLLGPPHPVAEMLNEPNTTTNEQASSSSAVPDDATHQLAYAVPRSSTDLPTPESFVRWLNHEMSATFGKHKLGPLKEGTPTWSASISFEAYKMLWKSTLPSFGDAQHGRDG